jgi:hypothetical protein
MAIGKPPKPPGGTEGGRFAQVGGFEINSYGMALEALRAAEQYFSARAGAQEENDSADD